MTDHQCVSCGSWDECPCGLDDWWDWLDQQDNPESDDTDE